MSNNMYNCAVFVSKNNITLVCIHTTTQHSAKLYHLAVSVISMLLFDGFNQNQLTGWTHVLVIEQTAIGFEWIYQIAMDMTPNDDVHSNVHLAFQLKVNQSRVDPT